MNESEANAHAVYVGSFDPLTLGHLDIIERGARLFQRLTVGIGINPDKKSMFTPEERVSQCQEAVTHLQNVAVSTFEGLAVEFVRDCGSRILLRGVRTLADLDTEFTMSLANRVLDNNIESVFLMAGERYNHISSSLIKQIAQLGQRDMRGRLKEFLPANIIEPLIARVQRPH